jgi:hypothetical protein
LFGTECSIVTIGIIGTTYDHQFIHTPKEKVGKIMMMVKEEYLVKNVGHHLVVMKQKGKHSHQTHQP